MDSLRGTCGRCLFNLECILLDCLDSNVSVGGQLVCRIFDIEKATKGRTLYKEDNSPLLIALDLI